MSAKDLIIQRAQRERHRILVPELTDSDHPDGLEMFFRPITAHDMSHISDLADGRKGHATYWEHCYLIVTKAEDRDGKRLFDNADAPVLYKNMDFIRLQRLAADIYGSALTNKEADAAVEGDPTSDSS